MNLKGLIVHSLKVVIALPFGDSGSVSAVAAMVVQMCKGNKVWF